MTTEEARIKFKNAGLKYSDLGSKEIAKLQQLVMQELKSMPDKGLEMVLQPMRKKDIDFTQTGTIKHAFLKVKGFYFDDREAISFSNGGFIGFAGWADAKNIQPFIAAFSKWVDLLTTPAP